MASQPNSKPPMRGFVPGLICGLVLGAFAGAIVPPFLDSKDLPKLEGAATADPTIQRERGREDGQQPSETIKNQTDETHIQPEDGAADHGELENDNADFAEPDTDSPPTPDN